MSIITERLSKFMFINKGLDKKLIEELKCNLNIRIILNISWYDGYDVNNIHSYKRYIYARKTDIKDHINNEIEYVLSKILSSDIMVFVGFYCYDLQNKLKQIIILDYRVPTDGYRFDKDLGKWMYGKSLEEITKSYNPTKDSLKETVIMLYVFLMVIVALLPTILGVCLSELTHEPCYMLFLVFEIPLIPSVWIFNNKIWTPFLKWIGYNE